MHKNHECQIILCLQKLLCRYLCISGNAWQNDVICVDVERLNYSYKQKQKQKKAFAVLLSANGEKDKDIE